MDAPEQPFKGYDKMHEDTQSWELSDADARALKRTQCAVLEKIHGANLCFICETGRIRAAKRHGILADSEDFFGHRRLLARIQPQLERVRVATLAELPPERSTGSAQVLVFGEIFGGAYPHPSVAAVEGVQAVQTGVYYAPDIDFCAFDVAVRAGEGAVHSFIDFETALALVAGAGLFCASPLFIGTWAQCLAFALPFPSTIPGRLGLPPLRDNKAEGVVIKTMRELRFPTRQGGATRAMLKKKIPEFAEDKRFHQAQKWDGPTAPPTTHLPPLTVLLLEIDALLEENRLAAAISKVGPLVARGEAGQVVPVKGRAKEVLQLLSDDLHHDLALRFAPHLAALTPSERQTLEESITEQAKRLILEHVKARSGPET